MNITIRMPDEMAVEIEKKRGDKSKAAFYREIIGAYLRSGMPSNEYVMRLENEVKYLRDALMVSMSQDRSPARAGRKIKNEIEGKLKKRASELLVTSPQDKSEPKSRRKMTGIWRRKRGQVYTGQPSPS